MNNSIINNYFKYHFDTKMNNNDNKFEIVKTQNSGFPVIGRVESQTCSIESTLTANSTSRELYLWQPIRAAILCGNGDN